MTELHKEFFYPEHEKLEKVQEVSQRIGEFLEWLGDGGMRICEFQEGPMRSPTEGAYWPIRDGITEILARYFDIDMNKIESEKQAMLQAVRERNQK